MNTLLSMKVFKQVVESGSFVTAAGLLNLSTAMTSKHVAHLEKYLNARLLNRSTRRLSLTEAGRVYHDQCAHALNDIEEAEQALRETAVVARGRLRVTCLNGIGMRHLPQVVSAYRAKHPEVMIDLTLTDRLIDLVEEGYDLAIRAVASEWRSTTLVARKIATAHFVVCASPAYVNLHGRPATPEALRQHDCLLFSSTAKPAQWVVGEEGEPSSVEVLGKFSCNNAELLRTAALCGTGIVFLPSDIVGDDLRNGDLIPLFPAHKAAAIDIYAVYPSRRYMSAKTRTFIDFLVEHFHQHSIALPVLS